jgi:hypothetical protein
MCPDQGLKSGRRFGIPDRFFDPTADVLKRGNAELEEEVLLLADVVIKGCALDP